MDIVMQVTAGVVVMLMASLLGLNVALRAGWQPGRKVRAALLASLEVLQPPWATRPRGLRKG